MFQKEWLSLISFYCKHLDLILKIHPLISLGKHMTSDNTVNLRFYTNSRSWMMLSDIYKLYHKHKQAHISMYPSYWVWARTLTKTSSTQILSQPKGWDFMKTACERDRIREEHWLMESALGCGAELHERTYTRHVHSRKKDRWWG